MKSQPKEVVIVGGGYIGIEFATTLKYLGSNVTLVIREEFILPNFDQEIAKILQENMQRYGICICQNTEICEIKKIDNLLNIRLKDKSEILVANQLIWAVGRCPNSKQLDLQNAGIEVDNKGFIVIDQYQTTTNKNVYAVGDVTNWPALTPVAIKAGRHLLRFLANLEEKPLELKFIPSVVFSHPPFATIGISEDDAKNAGKSIHIYQKTFLSMQDKLENKHITSIVKVIICNKTEQIIGCHLLGPGADEAIQGFSVAMQMNATIQDLNKCLSIHPTFAEEIVLINQG